MRRFLLLSSLLWSLAGCGGVDPQSPPEIRLGASVCARCDMILSDGRFATATVVSGPRGPEARLFDDFNCQAAYEHEHPAETVLRRWSRDYGREAWSHTESMHFLFARDLQTPMASMMAAFDRVEDARAHPLAATGEVLDFAQAWARLTQRELGVDRGPSLPPR